MKIARALIFLVAMQGFLSQIAFAQRQAAAGPGLIPLNATGILNGVDLSESGTTGTLTVGVPGGPETDIFTANNPPVAGFEAVSTANSSEGNIVFNSSSTVYGAIGTTQPGGPFLLNISAGNVGTAVNFLGPVFATTLNVNGTGAVNFNSGSINITATNFAADGAINLAPNTTVIGALTTTAGANTGTLGLGGGSVLNGAVGGAVGLKSINVVGGSSTAGVSATITGAVDAYSFSLGTNTLNVGGALTLANGGTGGVINTTLASPSVFGNIRPVGATILGPTLLVNVTVPSTAVILVGTKFNIIQTSTGTIQSGTNGSIVNITVQDPTNPLYTFSAVPASGTIAGLVTIQTTGIPLLVPLTPPPGVVLPPTVPVAVPLVPVLVTLGPSVPDIVGSINALTDPTAVVNAVAQLAPASSDLATPLVTFQGTQQFQNLLMRHLDTVLCGDTTRPREDPAACKGTDQKAGFWIKAFGLAADQGSTQQGYQGYTASVVGTAIGYDVPIGPNTRVGAALGFANNTITAKGFDNNTNFNTYDLTAYIGHQQGQWYIDGDLSFEENEYNTTRNVSFPGVNRSAQGSFDGQAYTAFATTGYHLPLQQFTITPLASLQYSHINVGNYTETGGGDINLAVNARSYDYVESGLGVKAARDFAYDGLVFSPDIHGKWFHEFDNPVLVETAAFAVPGSPSFTTPGLKTADNTFNVGAGIEILSCACTARTWSVEATYDYFWRTDNYAAHQGTLRFTARF